MCTCASECVRVRPSANTPPVINTALQAIKLVRRVLRAARAAEHDKTQHARVNHLHRGHDPVAVERCRCGLHELHAEGGGHLEDTVRDCGRNDRALCLS